MQLSFLSGSGFEFVSLSGFRFQFVSLPQDLRCVVMHIFFLESVDIVDSVAPSGFAFLLIFVFSFSFAVVLPSGFFSLNLWILWIVWLPQELAKTLENSFFADDDQHESFTFCLFALQLFFLATLVALHFTPVSQSVSES